MCEKIQGWLPSAADWDRLRPIFSKFNCFPRKADDAGDRYFVTGALCDCGTALGGAVRKQPFAQRQTKKIEEQIQQHRKDGWSEAKMQRWLAEVSKKPHALAQERQGEIERWLSLVKTLIQEGPVSSFGLVVYDAGSEQPSAMGKAKRVPLAAVEPQTLSAMESAQWYVFS